MDPTSVQRVLLDLGWPNVILNQTVRGQWRDVLLGASGPAPTLLWTVGHLDMLLVPVTGGQPLPSTTDSVAPKRDAPDMSDVPSDGLSDQDTIREAPGEGEDEEMYPAGWAARRSPEPSSTLARSRRLSPLAKQKLSKSPPRAPLRNPVSSATSSSTTSAMTSLQPFLQQAVESALESALDSLRSEQLAHQKHVSATLQAHAEMVNQHSAKLMSLDTENARTSAQLTQLNNGPALPLAKHGVDPSAPPF